MALTASATARCTEAGWFAGSPLRIAREVEIGAVAQDADRLQLVGLLGVGDVENDGGARRAKRPLDALVALLGECRIERGQQVGVFRLEDGLRRLETLGRIG